MTQRIERTVAQHAKRPQRRAARRVETLAITMALSLLATGCFSLMNNRNHGIGLEANRANLVVYKAATNYLYGRGAAHGTHEAREILVRAAPPKFEITLKQRAAMCTISPVLCLSADKIGRTLISWFKSDIKHRSDFWEALAYAGRHDRCFAWTFIPRRNLTHKGTGTAGCRTGVLI